MLRPGPERQQEARVAKICIVGYGYVGRSQHRLLSHHHDLGIWDPAAGYGNDQCQRDLESCDLAIICVPTPAREDGSCDTSVVEDAVDRVIETNQRGCLILIRSTVPPGTTSRLSSIHDPHHVGRVHFSPEFVVERTGDEARDRMIVGGPRAAEVLTYFERVLPAEARRIVCSSTEAEMVKYMTNAFLATKVAFCTEMSDIAKSMGMDYATLREIWLLDERVGRSHTQVYTDRRGFGGKCLPKDTEALEALAIERGVRTPLLSGVLEYSQGPDQPNGT